MICEVNAITVIAVHRHLIRIHSAVECRKTLTLIPARTAKATIERVTAKRVNETDFKLENAVSDSI